MEPKTTDFVPPKTDRDRADEAALIAEAVEAGDIEGARRIRNGAPVFSTAFHRAVARHRRRIYEEGDDNPYYPMEPRHRPF